MIMESEEGANRRYAIALSKGIPQTRSAFKCRLLGKKKNKKIYIIIKYLNILEIYYYYTVSIISFK